MDLAVAVLDCGVSVGDAGEAGYDAGVAHAFEYKTGEFAFGFLVVAVGELDDAFFVGFVAFAEVEVD